MSEILDLRGVHEVSTRWLRRFAAAVLPDTAPADGPPAYAMLLPHGHPVMTWEVAAPAIAASGVPDVLVYLSTSHATSRPHVLDAAVRTEAGMLFPCLDWITGSNLWKSGRITASREAFVREHTWRQDLLLWQWRAARQRRVPSLVSILVGDLSFEELTELVAHMERSAFEAWSSVTFVASGDLSHVGERYGALPGSKPRSADRDAALSAAVATDHSLLERLARRDVGAFRSALAGTSFCAREHAAAIAGRAPSAGEIHDIRALPFFADTSGLITPQDWFYVAGSVRYARMSPLGVSDLLELHDAGGDIRLRQRRTGAEATLVGEMAARYRSGRPAVDQAPPLGELLAGLGFRFLPDEVKLRRRAVAREVKELGRDVAGYRGLRKPSLSSSYRFPEALDREAPTRFLVEAAHVAGERGELHRRRSSGTSGSVARLSYSFAEQVDERAAVAARVWRRTGQRAVKLSRPYNLLTRVEIESKRWLYADPSGLRAAPGTDPAAVGADRWNELAERMESDGLAELHADPAYLAAFALALRARARVLAHVLEIEIGHGFAWPALVDLGKEVFPRARFSTLYHSSELGPIAATCPRGALHLLEERRLCQLAPVPDLDRRFGELLVTEVGVGVARPVVRFGTGDLVQRAPACGCGTVGRPIRMVGRLTDLLPGGITAARIGDALREDGVSPLFQLTVGEKQAELRAPGASSAPRLADLLRRPVGLLRALESTPAPAKFSFLRVEPGARPAR